MINTSATVDTVQGDVTFRSQGEYSITALESSVGTTIKTLEPPIVGDYIAVTTFAGTTYIGGNGTAKTVRLSNGWIVEVVIQKNSSTSYRHIFFVTEKGDWSDSRQLCYLPSGVNSNAGALTSVGVNIYYVYSSGTTSATMRSAFLMPLEYLMLH